MARRSVLFSPGDRPEMLRKAPGTGADVIVFDLEDAVTSEHKAEARETVREVVSGGFDPDCEVCVRVNPEPRRAAEDLRVVLGGEPGVDAVMLPKAESAADVMGLAGLVEGYGVDLPVFALVETALGVLHAEEIVAADPVTALAFGAEDLAAGIGANRSEDGTEVLYAREHVVLAASAGEVDAIDTVYTDVEDTEGLTAETEFAMGLGFDGKLAVHPAQVEVINSAFTPTEEQIEWARRVLSAREEADEAGRGVFRVDDEMIDAPLVAQAERIVERARTADLL